MRRKILALALAMIMIFGFSATAYASTAQVTVAGGTPINVTVPTTPKYSVPSGVVDPENSTVVTAMDILLQAFEDIKGTSIASQVAAGTLAYDWDQVYRNNDGTAGMYVSKFNNQTGSNIYYWLNPTSYQDDGYYRYRWVGSYWELTVNGNHADYYATHYLANTVTSLGFNMAQDSYEFNTTYPISGAIPIN